MNVLLQPIMKVVADNCLDIAMDKSGCCVLQQCVLHADGVSRDRLMAEIIANALPLSEHPYGFVPLLLVINHRFNNINKIVIVFYYLNLSGIMLCNT